MLVYALIFLILASVIGILFIISRKFSYLKRISPDIIIETDIDRGFFSTYFKEILSYLSSLNIRGESVKILAEIEKLLRSIKLMFLRVERHISHLINNIQEAVKEQESLIAQQKIEAMQKTESATVIVSDSVSISNRERAQLGSKEPVGDIKEYVGDILVDDSNSNIKKGVSHFENKEHKYAKNQSEGVLIDDFLENELELRKEEQKLILAIAKAPKDPSLYKLLGDIYFQLGQMEDSKESYEYALRLDPQDYILKTKLAKVLRNLDEIG